MVIVLATKPSINAIRSHRIKAKLGNEDNNIKESSYKCCYGGIESVVYSRCAEKSLFVAVSYQKCSYSQDQEEVGNLIEQLSSKNWQERIQAIDSMAEMIETRLPLFTSNMVKVKYKECTMFVVFVVR